MADYDLGTAHGKIKITSDSRGVSQAKRDIESLKSESAALGTAMDKAAKSSDRLSGATDRLGGSSSRTDNHVRSMASSIAGLAAKGITAGASMAGLTLTMQGMASASKKAFDYFQQYQQINSTLTTFSGALGSITKSLTGYSEAISGLSGKGKAIFALSGVLKGISAMWGVLGGAAEVASAKMARAIRIMSNSRIAEKMVYPLHYAKRAVLGLGAAIGGVFSARMLAARTGFARFGVAAAAAAMSGSRLTRILGTMGFAGWKAADSLQNGVGKAATAVASRFGASASAAALFGRRLANMTPHLVKTVHGMASVVVGMKMMSNGLKGITKASYIASAGVVAVGAAAVALRGIGTIGLGLWDGLKQLSGIVAVLPGALFSMGLAGAVAFVGIKNMSSAFSAASLEGDDFAEAIKDMSPFMKGIAKSAQKLYKPFKDLGDLASERSFAGLGKDIRDLGESYLPIFDTGIREVSRGLKAAKDGLVGFALDDTTLTDMNAAFRITGDIMGNVGRSIRPILSGLRDIGIAGMQSLSGMSNSWYGLSNRFADFSSRIRNDGSVDRWIKDSVEGTKDLGRILTSTGSIIGSVFRSIGGDGSNALERSAKAMGRWSEKVKESGETGGLREFMDSFGSIGDSGLQAIKSALREIGEIVKAFTPFLERMGSALGETLSQKLEMLGGVAEGFGKAMSAMPAMGSITGTILGMALFSKTVKMAGAAALSAGKFMAGSFVALGGASRTIQGATGSLAAYRGAAKGATAAAGNLGNAQEKVSKGTRNLLRTTTLGTAGVAHLGAGMSGASSQVTKLNKVTGKMTKGLGAGMAAIGGPLTIALAGAMAGAMAWAGASANAAAEVSIMKERADLARSSVLALGEAFTQAGGKMDSNVFSTMSDGLQKAQGNWAAQSANVLGNMDRVGHAIKDLVTFDFLSTSWRRGETGGAKAEQDERKRINVESGLAGIDSLRMSQENLTKAVSGTDEEYFRLFKTMRDNGADSNQIQQAANLLEPERKRIKEVEASFSRMGTSVPLNSAMKTLADDASTAAEKLNAVASALKALGILQTDADTAMIDSAKSIREMSDQLEGLFDEHSGFGEELFGDTAGINAKWHNALDMKDVTDRVAQDLQSVAAAGGDVQAAFEGWSPVLDSMREKLGIAGSEFDEAFSNVLRLGGGAIPELTIMASLKGKEEAVAELTALLLDMQSKASDKLEFRTQIKNEDALNALRELEGVELNLFGSNGEVDLQFKDADAKARAMALIELMGSPEFKAPKVTPSLEGSKIDPANIIDSERPVILPVEGELVNSDGIIPSEIPVQLDPTFASPAELEALRAGVDVPVNPVAPPPETLFPGEIPVQLDASFASPEELEALRAGVDVPINVLPPTGGNPNDIFNLIPAEPVVLPAPVVTPPEPVKVETTGAEEASSEILNLGGLLDGLQAPPPVDITLSGAEEAQGQLSALSEAAAGSIAGFQAFSEGVATAMMGAMAACMGAAASCAASLAGAAAGAFGSGASLGSGFAAGIQSQVGAVAAAAAALAAAASAPLPNSPAKVGPFSGKGWTPFRGAALAEGFAEGIAAGAPQAQAEALFMANQVATAMNQAYAGFNMPVFSATAKYMKQTSKTNEQLKQENLKKIEEREKDDARSKLRDEQKKAKDEAKEDRKNKERGIEPEVKEEKEKTAEQLQQDKWDQEDKEEQERYEKAIQLLEDGNGTQEEINAAIGEVASNTEAKDDETAEALRILGNQDAGDMETLAALEAIDRSIANQEDIETQDVLKSLRDSSMSRRGIEEIKPIEASTDTFGDSVKVAEGIFSLLDGFEKAVKEAGALAELAIRGFSNTKDITTAIDGVQGVFSAAASLSEGVMSVVSTVSSIAMAFGTLVPGVGAAAAAIGGFGSAVGTVNGIVDLVQQGMSVVGRLVGTGMALLAGGKDGMMYGKISTLIDTNDKTIKRWSDANVDDKRSTAYGKVDQSTKNTGVETLNIYQSPGVDPYRMVDEAMFAIRAEGAGVYA